MAASSSGKVGGETGGRDDDDEEEDREVLEEALHGESSVNVIEEIGRDDDGNDWSEFEPIEDCETLEALRGESSANMIEENFRCSDDDDDDDDEGVFEKKEFSSGRRDVILHGKSMMENGTANGHATANGPYMDPHLWGSLREELVEKIIARVPLKLLVQCQTLSKKWREVFHSTPFQFEVSSVSYRWGSYYPLYVSDKELMGYDRTCSKWQQLFTLPEFPEDFCRGFSGPLAWTLSLCSVTGSLIILSYFSNNTLHIFVSNPINKSVNRLPPLDLTYDAPLDPRFVDEWDESVLVLAVTNYSYKVLVFTRNVVANVLQVRVYDSQLNAWTGPQRGPVLPGDFRGIDSGVYVGKIFYLAFFKSIDETPCTLKSCLEDLMLFYAYDTDNGVFKEIVLPSPQKVPDVPIRVCKLVACGSELMLVVGQGSRDQDEEQRLESVRALTASGTEAEDNQPDSLEYLYIPKESFLVFRLDLKTLQLSEISRGPAEKLSSRTFTGLVVCDKDCIYLQTEAAYGNQGEFGVVMFDMHMQVWSPLPLDTENRDYNVNLTEFAFQPGLNPFVSA